MLQDPSLSTHIRWNQFGDEIVINMGTIESVLGQYFKTSSFLNFTKRLYNYGFRKLSKDSILGVCHYGGQINFRRDSPAFSDGRNSSDSEDISSSSMKQYLPSYSQTQTPPAAIPSTSSSVNSPMPPSHNNLASNVASRSEEKSEQILVQHLTQIHRDLTSAYYSIVALSEHLYQKNSRLRSENQFMILQIEEMISPYHQRPRPAAPTKRQSSPNSSSSSSSSSSPSSSPSSKRSRTK